MKNVLLLTFLFGIYLPVRAQIFRQAYKIDSRYALLQVQREIKDTVKTTKIERIITGRDGKQETTYIEERQNIQKPIVLSKRKFVAELAHANLLQNVSGDSIEVQFFGINVKIKDHHLKQYNISKGRAVDTELNYDEMMDLQKTLNDGIDYDATKDWRNPVTGAEETLTEVNPDEKGKYYLIFDKRTNLRDAPLQYILVNYTRAELGVATMPFKYRFGRSLKKLDEKGDPIKIPNDVAAGINVGLYAGYKWGQTLFYNDPKRNSDRWGVVTSVFTGPTVIAINKDTNVKKTVTRSLNEPGWQAGAGVWLTYRNVEVGVFYGYDFALSYAGKSGDYANRPWLGFGLGYKLEILNLKDK